MPSSPEVGSPQRGRGTTLIGVGVSRFSRVCTFRDPSRVGLVELIVSKVGGVNRVIRVVGS